MTVSAMVVVSCVDLDPDRAAELRDAVSPGISGRHIPIGKPVRISKTPDRLSIVPSDHSNAKFRSVEDPGQVPCFVYNAKTDSYKY